MNENEIRLEILKIAIDTLDNTYKARLKGVNDLDEKLRDRMRLGYPGISDIITYSDMMADFVFDEEPIEESTEGL